MRKKIILMLVPLVIVGASLVLLKYSENKISEQDGPRSNLFFAEVQRVEGDMIYAKGFFIGEDRKYISNEEADVRIKITAETKITKEVIIMPTREEFSKLKNGVWIPDPNRTKNIVAGSVSDFSMYGGLILEVVTVGNIFGRDEFEASEIFYTEQIYPDFK